MRSTICIDCEREDCPIPSQFTIRTERMIRDDSSQPLPVDPLDEFLFYQETLTGR